ncbi:iron-containing alcohol dehydrogenase family protein [Paenibacillus prosopidis]|uniref:Glycerol-1-phosphate dehydrogenase [NAD(P)+] n=1 Tax=Paenibacillus prosopidis TaxID=630520 RepID=A0A368W113_9BACL|nr:iron-containing alcohol dehydrogenase family protein [Paenibacillus prosopidis]RCW48028.1 glycerol-1-phosphate dehydrogenase [NAD(P)+] [Paenibacillus prosopidis]
MSNKMGLPAHLIYEPKAFERLYGSEICDSLANRRVVVISGKGATRKISEQLILTMKLQPVQIKALYCTDNTLRTIDELEIETRLEYAEVIIGVGGGKVLDVSKVVGTRMNVPVMLVPTALSCDAVCSPVASIRVNQIKSISIEVGMPWAVVIDLDIVAGSPHRLFCAGIGDLLSNKTALVDWKLAHQVNKEKIDTVSCMIANNAVDIFLNSVNENNIGRAALLKMTVESIIMSGIAMAIAGSSRPCSGSEHLISHALDNYCGGKALHGEQVAVAMLISEYLQGDHNSGNNMRQHFKILGLPTHYKEIGYTKDEMCLAIQKAPSIRNRYTILNEMELKTKQINYILDEVFPLSP